MIEIPVSGRKLLEVAKRVRARVLESGGEGEPKRYPTDAELAELIRAEVEHAREAHRERMRAYYRQRRASGADKRSAAGKRTGARRRTKRASD